MGDVLRALPCSAKSGVSLSVQVRSQDASWISSHVIETLHSLSRNGSLFCPRSQSIKAFNGKSRFRVSTEASPLQVVTKTSPSDVRRNCIVHGNIAGRSAGAVHGSRARRGKRTRRKRTTEEQHIDDDLGSAQKQSGSVALQDAPEDGKDAEFYAYGDSGDESMLEYEEEAHDSALDDRNGYFLPAPDDYDSDNNGAASTTQSGAAHLNSSHSRSLEEARASDRGSADQGFTHDRCSHGEKVRADAHRRDNLGQEGRRPAVSRSAHGSDPAERHLAPSMSPREDALRSEGVLESTAAVDELESIMQGSSERPEKVYTEEDLGQMLVTSMEDPGASPAEGGRTADAHAAEHVGDIGGGKKEKKGKHLKGERKVLAASAVPAAAFVAAAAAGVQGGSSSPAEERQDPLHSTSDTAAQTSAVALEGGHDGPSNSMLEDMAENVKVITDTIADSVVDILPDQVVEAAGQAAEGLSRVADQVADQVGDLGQSVAEALPDAVVELGESISEAVSDTVAQVSGSVVETVGKVSESVSSATETLSETVSAVTGAVGELLSHSDDGDEDDEDELEAFRVPDAPEFRGIQGMNNIAVKQENEGVLTLIYDAYIYTLKLPFPAFAAGMFALPLLLSLVFTLLYLPDYSGLVLDDTAQRFYDMQIGGMSASGGDGGPADAATSAAAVGPAPLTWLMVFQIFMFSLSLATGLQPELAPLSSYALIVANCNALIAELIFVFLSGAVFARLSQPSQPVRCANVALITPPSARRRQQSAAPTKVLMARYVLAGPQPCELVDVKVDLTFRYNTCTRSGTYFRAQQSLKLLYHGTAQVRPEVAYQTYGMLVRHVIDETSPLYRRTAEMMRQEDAIFSLSVVGLERSSMQSVFHVQHYSVVDNNVIWDAEFEDIVRINKRNKRICDHRLLNSWRPVK